MRTLVHLSDLHFGRVDAGLLAPLRELIHNIAPDVLVVSGDLTQRARSEEFEQARAFLDTLPGPQIVVPGNHDISLYNVFRRFAKPLDRYKRYITDDLDPIHIDGEIAVVGVNTARSLTIKDGRVNREQVGRIRERLAGLDPRITRIVVTHHPFDLPETFEQRDLVNRAPMAMEVFAECGVDVLLAGHMHVSHAASTAMRYQIDAYAALVVQAGTATSTRGRGET
ncbi:MAG TPA: metallophosphatase, partial [Massilia sp.]|nr:metallophosphatase [Massilia sp.]